MGFLKRWFEANRISNAGKETANALRGGLARSKKEYEVIRHVGELRAEAADAISHIQKSCDPETREWIARNLYQLVLQAPRGEEGHQRLFALDQRARQAKDIGHCAPWLARLLVLADHVCERAGGAGLAAGMLVAEMQGWMEHFMAENGIRGWGVPIVEASRFDALRSSRPKGERVELTPVGESGVRGEAFAVAARALGLANDKWTEESLMIAATCVSSAIMNHALKSVGRNVAGLTAEERVAVAVGLWATADATCQHARLAAWELVPMLAHAQLFLDCNAAQQDPEAAGASLGAEARIQGDAFCALQSSPRGMDAIMPLGQAAKDFCRTGDERYLAVLGSAAMSLAPFVQVGRDTARVVLV